MEIQVTDRFVKQYKKLPNQIKLQAKQKEALFRGNPFDPSLRTHKLVGKEKECWSLSVNHAYGLSLFF